MTINRRMKIYASKAAPKCCDKPRWQEYSRKLDRFDEQDEVGQVFTVIELRCDNCGWVTQQVLMGDMT